MSRPGSAGSPRGASLEGSQLPPRIFEGRSGDYRDNFNRRAFSFRHSLADHPLFEIRRLAELSKSLWSLGEGRVILQAAETPLDGGWANVPGRALSVLDSVTRIEESNSWVLLKGIQKDPAYRELLEQAMSELELLTAVPLGREVSWTDAYVFIASPNSVTPYHIDHESNFLLQIHGEKDDHLFDGEDRSILSEEEIELYYMGNLSGARFRDAVQEKANVFRLTPGTGVHHPVRWPHWVRNGPEYSVSLSVLFFLRGYDREAPVYQFNHLLRRLGMEPTPPGRSPLRDGLKRFAVESFASRKPPSSKDEVIRSGISRLKRLARFSRSRKTVPSRRERA